MQWSKLQASESFQSLSDSDKETVRDRYFNDFISPNLNDEERESGYQKFRELTGGDIQTSGEWSDFPKHFVGAATKVAGDIVGGVGDAVRSVISEDPISSDQREMHMARGTLPVYARDFLENPEATEFKSEEIGLAIDRYNQQIANRDTFRSKIGGAVEDAIDVPAQKLRETGDEIKDSASYLHKKEIEKSEITGDITDPDSWSFGDDPSLRGLASNALDVAASLTPQIATAYLTRGQSLKTQLVAGGSAGFLQAGGAASHGVQEVIGNLSDDELGEQSKYFADKLKEGFSPEEARKDLINIISTEAFERAGSVGGIGGVVTGYIFSPLSKLGGQSLAGKLTANTLTEGTKGAIEEVGEGAAEQSAYNDGGGFEKDLLEGSFGNAVLGFLGEAPGGTVASLQKQSRQVQKAKKESEAEQAAQLEKSSNDAMESLKAKYAKIAVPEAPQLTTEHQAQPEADFTVDSEGNTRASDYQQPAIEKDNVIYSPGPVEAAKAKPEKDGMTDTFDTEYQEGYEKSFNVIENQKLKKRWKKRISAFNQQTNQIYSQMFADTKAYLEGLHNIELRNKNLFDLAREFGGISRQEAIANGVDPSQIAAINKANPFNPVFSKKGLSFDGFAEMLNDNQVITPYGNAIDAIQMADYVVDVSDGKLSGEHAGDDLSDNPFIDRLPNFDLIRETLGDVNIPDGRIIKAINAAKPTKKQKKIVDATKRAISALNVDITESRQREFEFQMAEEFNALAEQPATDTSEEQAFLDKEKQLESDFGPDEPNEIDEVLDQEKPDISDNPVEQPKAYPQAKTDPNQFDEEADLKSDSVPSDTGQSDIAVTENTVNQQVDLFDSKESIEEKVKEVNTEPTEAQKEVGNYKKGHIKIQGLDISIENPKGSYRKGTSPDGKKWSTKMKQHYGYFKRSEGADGDNVDVFVGDKVDSDKVFIVDQVNADGSFDEHKVMLGFDNQPAAITAYKSNYQKGWKVGPVTQMSMDDFKAWLKNEDTKKPAEQVIKPTKDEQPKKSNLPVESWLTRKIDKFIKTFDAELHLNKDKWEIRAKDNAKNKILIGSDMEIVNYANSKILESRKEKPEPEALKGTGLSNKTKLSKKSASKKTKTKKQDTKKLEDFGERLGGARKDEAAAERFISRNLTDQDYLDLPLSKIWPKKEVDDIQDKDLAAFMFVVRGEVPGKPRKSYLKKRWAEQVKQLRGLGVLVLNKLKRDSLTLNELLTDIEKKSDGIKSINDRIRLLQNIDRKDWGRIGRVNIAPSGVITTGFKDTKQTHHGYIEVQIDGYRELYPGEKDLAAVLPAIKSKLSESSPKKSTMRFEVRGRKGNYRINKKGDSEYRELAKFADSKAAFAFIRDNHDQLVEAWEKVKQRDNVKKTDTRSKVNLPRTGEDYRQGKDVTPELFSETFGFRGVEFGKWVKQGVGSKERQRLLNETFDALLDLANILNIPPLALSFNGQLGLGLGSRGTGGWAAAHFETGYFVINLTKTQGAGSLAHEWFHALDNYFSLFRGKEREFITNSPERLWQHKNHPQTKLSKAMLEKRRKDHSESGFFEPKNWVVDQNYREGVRVEVEKAFTNLVEKLNESPMKQRAKIIDKNKTDGYWSSTTEMAARSFENYVIYKMQQRGYHNDFLANVTTIDKFARAPQRYPYLLKDELKPIKKAFDKLFETIKIRKTDKGLEIHEPDSVYSKDERETSNLHRQRRDDNVSEPENDSGRMQQRDLFLKQGSNPSEVKQQLTDIYHTQVKPETVSFLNSPVDTVESDKDLALLVRDIGRKAQETMLGIVTDKKGKVLRVIRHTGGLKAASQVDPLTLVAEVASIDDAAKLHLAHNHPSGATEPSSADVNVTEAIEKYLDGTGISIGSHAISTPKNKTVIFISGGINIDYVIDLPEQGKKLKKIPVSERFFEKSDSGKPITSPEQAEELIRAIETDDAIILVNNQHSPVGIVFLSANEMKKLRDNGRVNRILKAIDATNASGMFLKSNDREAAANISRFISKAREDGFRLLDWFTVTKDKFRSARQSHDPILDERGHFYRLSHGAKGIDPKQVDKAKAIFSRLFEGAPLNILKSESDLPKAVRKKVVSDGNAGLVKGIYANGTVYVIGDAHRSIPDLTRTVLHETVAHYGLRKVLGSGYNNFIQKTLDAMPQKVRIDVARRHKLKMSEQAKIAEEYIAEIAETNENASLLDKLVVFLKKLLKPVVELGVSDRDIRVMLTRTKDFLMRQKRSTSEAGRGPGVSYSLKSDGRTEKQWQSVERRKDGPYYEANDFVLMPQAKLRTEDDFSTDNKKLPLGHPAHVEDGIEAWEFRVIDSFGQTAAIMQAQVDPKTNEIIAIHDIDVLNKQQGLGEKVVSSILANSTKPVKIVEMLDSSWAFWQKMGASNRDQYKNGTIEWKQYLGAVERRSAPGRVEKEQEATDTDREKNAQESTRSSEVEINDQQEPGPEDDWLYRVHTEDPTIQPTSKWYDSILRYFQDKYVDLKRTQQAIKKYSQIDDEANVYERETLMHGKAERALEKFEKEHRKPLSRFLQENNIEPEELDLYLYAKHAPERNKALFDFYNDNQTDLFLAEPVSESLSGMTDQEAKAIIDEIKRAGRATEFEAAAKRVYKMLRLKRELLHENGLLSDEQALAWENNYKYYVPLKGFAADEAEWSKGFFEKLFAGENPFKSKVTRSGGQIIGRGFAIKGKESLKALGRRTTAGSILSHTSADVAAAILRSEKNKVAQSLLKLVEDNPDSNYWSIHTVDNPAKTRSRNTGQMNDMSEREMANSDEFVPVKRDGHQFYIRIRDLELVAAMKNMNVDEAPKVIRVMGAINRYLSTMSTSLSPDFIVSNFFRDLQTGLFNALGETTREDGKLKEGSAKDLFKLGALKGGYRQALRAIYRQERGKPVRPGNEWDAAFREYLDAGAKTGFFDSKTIEQQAADFKRLIEIEKGSIKGKALKYGHEVLHFVEDLNAAVENTTRLVAYKYARDVGLSKQKAAVFAKDLTVNFNRRGSSTTWLNAAYMFANASIQGNANFVRSMGQNPIYKDPFTGKRSVRITGAQAAGLTMVGAGYLLSMLARTMGGEADDGEDWIDKVPDYVTERNMVFFLPDDKMFTQAYIESNPGWFGKVGEKVYYKIPLPYGYNIFHNLGSGVEQVSNGSKRKNNTWLSKYMAFSILGSFSPVGSANSDEFGDGALKTVTPTVAKPFVDMALNENYFGTPIYKDRRFVNPETPDSATGKERTWEGWKGLAESINEISGGSTYKKGAVDIAPESFEYLFKYATGGFGTFINNAMETAESLQDSEKSTDVRKLPIARKLVGKTSAYQGVSDFYDRLDEVELVLQEWKDLPFKEKKAFKDANKDAISLAHKGKQFEKKLKKYRQAIRRFEEKESLTDFETKQLERVRRLEQKVIDQFNEAYNQLK